MNRTLDEIRTAGPAALRRSLGRVGMIRFLQQYETGSGDYARERRKWVDQTSMEELDHLLAEYEKARKTGRKRTKAKRRQQGRQKPRARKQRKSA